MTGRNWRNGVKGGCLECFGGHLDTLHHTCIMGASTLHVHSNINHELCYKETEISIPLSFKQSMQTSQLRFITSSCQHLNSTRNVLPRDVLHYLRQWRYGKELEYVKMRIRKLYTTFEHSRQWTEALPLLTHLFIWIRPPLMKFQQKLPTTDNFFENGAKNSRGNLSHV